MNSKNLFFDSRTYLHNANSSFPFSTIHLIYWTSYRPLRLATSENTHLPRSISLHFTTFHIPTQFMPSLTPANSSAYWIPTETCYLTWTISLTTKIFLLQPAVFTNKSKRVAMGSYHSRQIADLVLLMCELDFFLTTMTQLDFLFFAGT